jgi:uncharacterized HAD superfamily protein
MPRLHRKKVLNIGFDLDGVLANFAKAFSRVCNSLYGERCFLVEHENQILDWYWSNWYPVTQEESDTAFNVVYGTENFWANMEIMDHSDWSNIIQKLSHEKDINIYFITSRSENAGDSMVRQCISFLTKYGFENPQIIVSDKKAEFINLLNIKFFIDDSTKNVLSIHQNCPNCKIYTICTPHNKDIEENISNSCRYKRVSSLKEYIDDVYNYYTSWILYDNKKFEILDKFVKNANFDHVILFKDRLRKEMIDYQIDDIKIIKGVNNILTVKVHSFLSDEWLESMPIVCSLKLEDEWFT